MPCHFNPLVVLWTGYLDDVGFKSMESAWDCCWVSVYNIAFVIFAMISTPVLIIIDILVILLFIVPYDFIYGIFYGSMRCLTCGRCEELKSGFIQIDCERGT